MTRYHMRVVCETPEGNRDFHYHKYTVDATEPPTTHEVCPDHPTAVHRDLVIERKEAL